VQLQGEIIDNIAANIATAKDYVLKAEVDIVQAKKNMQSARKKKCCILIIVLVIVAVIVGPVLGVKLGSA
jgi:syntaxin 1B/2/3